MKKLNTAQKSAILIILCVNSLLLYGRVEEASKSEDEYYWEYIANTKNTMQLLAKGTWRYTIKGEYNQADSLFFVSQISELDSLMEAIDFEQDAKNPDFIIRLNTKTLYENHTYNAFLSSNDKKLTNSIECDITYSDTINQEQRNRILQYYIINLIVNGPQFYYHDRTVPSDVANYMINGNGILWGEKWNKINNTDKEIIRRLYLKNFQWNFMISYPEHYVFFVKKCFPNLSDFIFKAILYCLLILYFYSVYRLGVFRNRIKNWLSYNKMAIVIAIGFMFMFILQFMYINNLVIRELRNFSWGYFFIFIGIMILLNIVYLIDLFIDNFVKESSGNNIAKFISSLILTIIPASFMLLQSKNMVYNLTTDWVLFVLTLLISRAIIFYQDIRIKNAVKEKDLQLANLQKLQHQTELQAIQSRINPHFLYNSLNSIASLCRISPEKSESMALALSSFCRYSINKKNEKMASIEAEIESVKTYLEIEKIRFSEQLEYSIEYENNLKDQEIPRFLIQPLVENAIKHGTSEIIEKGIIKIEIKEENDNLILKVSDNGKDFPEEPVFGYGLQSIYDKLEIMYKGNATINWTNKPEKAIILSLPIK